MPEADLKPLERQNTSQKTQESEEAKPTSSKQAFEPPGLRPGHQRLV